MTHARARARWIVLGLMVIVALVVGRLLAPGEASGPSTRPSPSSSPSLSYPAAWSRYAPADGSFHLMAPGEPTERQGQTDAGMLHRTDFAPPGDGAWFVEWLDVTPEVAAGRSDADLIDLVLAPLVDRLDAQIDEEDILRDGPFPGVELHLSAPGGTGYLIRVLAADGRLVEATAELPPGSSPSDAEGFVRSLELDRP